MAPVSRLGRLLDAIGLVIFLAGLGLAGRAWIGFRGLQGTEASAADPATSAVEIADGYWGMQRLGVALMLVGVAVFVGAWWTARREKA